LNSASCLDFSVKDNFLKKLDDSKTNQRNQQYINITDQEKQLSKNGANDIKEKLKYCANLEKLKNLKD
jgi:hypothetical protein